MHAHTNTPTTYLSSSSHFLGSTTLKLPKEYYTAAHSQTAFHKAFFASLQARVYYHLPCTHHAYHPQTQCTYVHLSQFGQNPELSAYPKAPGTSITMPKPHSQRAIQPNPLPPLSLGQQGPTPSPVRKEGGNQVLRLYVLCFLGVLGGGGGDWEQRMQGGFS
jgi:hypothetical protein